RLDRALKARALLSPAPGFLRPFHYSALPFDFRLQPFDRPRFRLGRPQQPALLFGQEGQHEADVGCRDMLPLLYGETPHDLVDGNAAIKGRRAQREIGMFGKRSKRSDLGAAVPPRTEISRINSINDETADRDRKFQRSASAQRIQLSNDD